MEKNELVVPHTMYRALGVTSKECCEAYSALFEVSLTQKTIEEIREATNKSWVLGSRYFKEKIKDKINRPVKPRMKGGDRKSKAYQESIKSASIDSMQK